MIIAWMLYSLVVGVLIGMAAYAADRCCRLLQWPRRWVWIGSLLATVVLSAAGLWRMISPPPPSPARTMIALPAVTVSEVSGSGIERAVALLLGSVAAVREAVSSWSASAYSAVAAVVEPVIDGGLVLSLWTIATAALLLMLGLTLLRVQRARRSWRQARIAGIPVLLSEDFGPAVIGIVRPVVVAPSWLLRQPEPRQHMIVQHEDEHRRARDPLLLATVCLATCLLPWNAVLWWLLVRCRLAVELDCDARLLRRGVAPLCYGELLLEIAGRTPGRLLGAPALTDSRLHLERRLLAMTERSRRAGRARPLLAGAAAVLLVVAACRTEAPTSAAIEDMDVAAATTQAEQSGLLPKESVGKPLFMVDGKVVSETDVSALAPEEIASIQVLKGEGASAYGERGANGVIVISKRDPGERASAARALLQEKAVAAVAEPPQEPAKVKTRAALDSKAAAEVEKRVAEKAKTVIAVRKKAAAAAGDAATAKAGKEQVAVEAKAAAEVKWAEKQAKEDVVIRKKAVAVADEAVTITAAEAKAAGQTADPLIVIDDVMTRSSTALPALAPSEILSVEVLKGEAAIRRFGVSAANGAIVITTKKKNQ
jgi:beta-lactamase regulating signal transducer with metallopeptidase domain